MHNEQIANKLERYKLELQDIILGIENILNESPKEIKLRARWLKVLKESLDKSEHSMQDTIDALNGEEEVIKKFSESFSSISQRG
jgi:hypothetical protein